MSTSYEEVIACLEGHEVDFAVLFTDDLTNQLDLIIEDTEELISIFCTLKETPTGSAFLSLLLGVHPETWLEENILSRMEEDEESE